MTWPCKRQCRALVGWGAKINVWFSYIFVSVVWDELIHQDWIVSPDSDPSQLSITSARTCQIKKKNRCMSQLIYRESKSKIKKKIFHQSFRKLSTGNSIVSQIRILPLSKHRFLPHKQLFVWKYLYDKILTFGNRVIRAYDWVFVLTIEYKNLLIQKCNDA